MENLDKLKIGEFINSRREYLKITQEDLGEKLGVTDEDVSEWEEGQKIPDINLLPSLANILDVSNSIASLAFLSGDTLLVESLKSRTLISSFNVSKSHAIPFLIFSL